MEINLDQNSASLKIDKAIYLRILAKAVSQTQNDISDLEAALPVDDYDKVQSIAHRLKGDYDNMRLTEMSTIAKQMNEISKDSKDKEALNGLLKQFKEYFEQLKSVINQQPGN